MHVNCDIGSIRLDRQEPFLEAQHLDALIAAWLDDVADRLDQLGPDGYIGTAKGYAVKVQFFRDWWVEVGPGIDWRLTRQTLREFERWLRCQPSRFGGTLSYHTRNDSIRRLRSMFKWAQAEGYIVNVHPADWVPAAVGNPPEPVPVADASLGAIMQAAASGPQPARDIAILAVLIGTGMRRAECAALNIEDVRLVDDCSGEIVIRHPKKTVAGDGQPLVRHVAIDGDSGRYVRYWIACQGLASGPLFPSRQTGEHLLPRSLYMAVRRCWERAGLTTSAPCHDLRRKYVTEWRRLHKNSADELLGMQVGHTDPRMSSLYSLQEVRDLVGFAGSPMQNVAIEVEDWPRMS